jgi:hypothetical protein
MERVVRGGRARWKNVVSAFSFVQWKWGEGDKDRYDLDLRGLWEHLGFTLEMC